jgi:hypothetical protein
VRLVAFGFGLLFAAFAAVVLTTNVFRPPPAADRLAGVTVSVAGYTIEDIDRTHHRLHLRVAVASIRDLADCLGFTLDEPFAGRRIDTASGA